MNIPAFFYSKTEKNKMEGQVIHYFSETYLNNILTWDDIVVKNDEKLIAILNDALFSCQEILFMAIDNERSSEKINKKYCYVLWLYSSLINGQKAVVILLDI